MPHYRIIQSTTNLIIGEFVADSPEAARDAGAKRGTIPVGYTPPDSADPLYSLVRHVSYEELCNEFGDQNWHVFEIPSCHLQLGTQVECGEPYTDDFDHGTVVGIGDGKYTVRWERKKSFVESDGLDLRDGWSGRWGPNNRQSVLMKMPKP